MDYNNFNHYAKERMTSLRGERKSVERWHTLGAKVTPLARLRTFFKTLNPQPTKARQGQRQS